MKALSRNAHLVAVFTFYLLVVLALSISHARARDNHSFNPGLPGSLLNSTDWVLNFSDCARDLDPTYNLHLTLEDTHIEARGDWSTAHREGRIKLRGTYHHKTAQFEMANRSWELRGKFYTSDGVTKIRGEVEDHPTMCAEFTGEQSKTKKDLFLVAAVNNRVIASGDPAVSTRPANETFGRFAAELLEGIGDADLVDISGQSGYGRPGIAINPLNVNRSRRSRVGSALSGELNARLLAEMIKQGGGRFKFIETVSPFWTGVRPVAGCKDNSLCALRKSTVVNNKNVDIVIVGNLRLRGEKAYLSYRALGAENGVIYAASVPRQIWLSARTRVSEGNKNPSWHELKRSLIYTDHGFWFRQQIKFLQRGLRHLGYRPGRSITGKLDLKTRKAIRSYQWHHKLPVTGLYSHALLDHIERQLVVS